MYRRYIYCNNIHRDKKYFFIFVQTYLLHVNVKKKIWFFFYLFLIVVITLACCHEYELFCWEERRRKKKKKKKKKWEENEQLFLIFFFFLFFAWYFLKRFCVYEEEISLLWIPSWTQHGVVQLLSEHLVELWQIFFVPLLINCSRTPTCVGCWILFSKLYHSHHCPDQEVNPWPQPIA